MKKFKFSLLIIASLIVSVLSVNHFVLGADGTIGQLDVFKTLSGYIETRSATGYDLLLKGTTATSSRYLNFGVTNGTNGIGFRNNAGTIEYKNLGGSWAGVGTGGGGATTDSYWTLSGSNLSASSTSWNIGIGTSSPTYKLDINGSLRSNSTTTLSLLASTTNTLVAANSGGTLFSVPYNNTNWDSAYSYRLLSAGAPLSLSSNSLSISKATAAVDGYLAATDFTTFNNKISSQWATSGSNISYVAGSVGIGTTNPGALLQVAGNTIINATAVSWSEGLSIDSSDGTWGGIKWRTNGYGNTLNWHLGYSGTHNSAANADLVLYNGAGNYPMVWKQNGNVGIGTTAPGAKLDVNGTISASGSGGFVSATYQSGARNPIWRFGNADGYGVSYFQGTAGIGGLDTIGFHFGTATATSSLLQINQNGTITTSGNVGIGLTAPSAALHIKAGTTSVAPFKFTEGTNLASPAAGALEWDGTNLFVTQTSGPTRKTIAYTTDITGGGGGATTTISGVSGPTFTFNTGTTGTDFGIATSTGNITFNLPTSSASNRGLLSAANWSTFSGKQDALNGTGFIKASGTTISYDNSTYITSASLAPYLSTTTAASTYAPLTSPTFGTSINGSYLTASQILGTDASKNIVSLPVATYPSLTEFSYVKGLTSAIQTQLNGKQATLTNPVTGTGTTNEISYWTAAGTQGTLAVATYPNLTELSYVKGVTSAIQTQLNGKQASGTYSTDIHTNITALNAVSGTNTGDNSANSNYASDYRAANFIAGTNYVATTTGSWLGTWQGNNPSAFSAETTSTIGTLVNGAGGISISDSDIIPNVHSSLVYQINWTSIKAFLKTYFDGIYATIASIPAKISGATLDSLTDDTGFVTAKAVQDGHNIPHVIPGASGNLMTSNGTDWATSSSSIFLPTAVSATAGTDHSATGPTTNSINSGYSSTLMDLVYLGSAGKWLATDADASSTSNGLLGIALESKTDTQAMNVAMPGTFVRDDSWTFATGTPIYISTDLAKATSTQPSGTDDVIRVIGFAVTSKIIWFSPSNDYLTHN